MAEPEHDNENDPVCHPHLVRLLRKRPKLFDLGLRDRALESVEYRMCQRRSPDAVAERATKAAERVAEPVAMDTASETLKKANGSILRRF